jgi:hypothetical protein
LRYTELVIYNRYKVFNLDGSVLREMVQPVRVTAAHDYVTAVNVPMESLFLGHCEWIGEQINAREERQAA